jgi:hypothetical protein
MLSGACILLALIASTFWLGGQDADPQETGSGEGQAAQDTSSPVIPPSPQAVSDHAAARADDGGSGGTSTASAPSKRDVDSAAQGDDAKPDPSERDPFDYGRTPPVEPDANPQVAAVFAAIQNREADPESYAKAVSPLAKADPFDREKYVSDQAYRDSYLNTPQPSRVFDPAQPGKDVPQLRRISPAFQKVKQGTETKLRVRAVPGAPVTFTSFDLGRFENQLTTITVQADANGVAEAGFTGPPGTIDDVSILVASPVTSGQVRLVVHVTRS